MNVTYKNIHQKKMILGYHCEKFIGKNQDNDETYEIWATKELPGSIVGLYRLPQFGNAVLEISNKMAGWTQAVSKISTLDKNKNIFEELL